MHVQSTLARLMLGIWMLCAMAAPALSQPQFEDQFGGSVLAPGWTILDGYAQQHPSDTANHASVGLTGSQLSISFPGGVEHNMFWLKHAQVTRPYGGDGVYEIKMDSPLNGAQQFGLVFQSAPGTFMIFMLYATDQVRAYIERFVNHQGFIQKATFGGQVVAPNGPNTGPFYMRVVVDDDPDPTKRTWRWDWSADGAGWIGILSGGFEGAQSTDNIGAVQEVGLFAGNHPPTFDGFDARFDYFRRYASLGDVPFTAPSGLIAWPGDNRVDLSWLPVDSADSYGVYVGTTPGGPYSLLSMTSDATYADLTAVNGNRYAYVVKAFRAGLASPASSEVTAIPRAAPAELPAQGLVLALRASDLAGTVADGEPVTQWFSAAGPQTAAFGTIPSAPTFDVSGINGQPVVRFDGINDFLTLTSGFANFTAGMSLYVVTRPTVLQPGFKLFLLGNDALQQNISLGRAGTTAGYQYFTNSASGELDFFNTPDGLVAGEAAMISLLQGPGSANTRSFAEVAKNGVALGGDDVWVPANATRSLNYIGKSYFPGDGLFQGEIAEILLYNRTLTAGEQTVVRSYVAQKYGLPIEGTGPVNLAPSLAHPGNQTVTEGSELTVALQATDPNAGQLLSYSLVSGPAGATVDESTGVLRWTPPDGPATASFTVRVTDNGVPSLSATTTFAVSVTNVAPTLQISGPATVTLGQVYTLTLSVSDPGTDAVSQWRINWGDSVQLVNGSPGNVTHTYAAGGNYTITATATDEDGTYAPVSRTVIVNTPPSIRNPGAKRNRLNVPVNLQIIATDPGDTLTYSASGLPNGLGINTSTGLISGTPTRIGNFNVVATVTDSRGAKASVTFKWEITNKFTTPAPTVILSANPTTIAAGQTSRLTWMTFQATWCWASGGWSGTRPTGAGMRRVSPATTRSYSLTCTGPGGSASRTVTVTVN